MSGISAARRRCYFAAMVGEGIALMVVVVLTAESTGQAIVLGLVFASAIGMVLTALWGREVKHNDDDNLSVSGESLPAERSDLSVSGEHVVNRGAW